MRLSERYRPATLDGVVGQPYTQALAAFCREPCSMCWLLEGSPGTGKTTSALAVAAELGCYDEFSGLSVVCGSELSVDRARDTMRALGLRPMMGGRWQVLVIEELERLSSQCQVLLKVGLERDLPAHAVVLATSNDPSDLQPALLQRFTRLRFGSRDGFAAAGNERVAEIWLAETGGAPMPRGWQQWGYSNGEQGRFSLRVAIDQMQVELLTAKAAAAAA